MRSQITRAEVKYSRPPRVALFTAGYGGGHNTSVYSTRDLLLREDPVPEIKIFSAQNYFVGANLFPRLADFSTEAFNKIYQNAPGAWDRIFALTMWSAENKTSAGDIPNPLFSSRRMLTDLNAFQPDLIISTFHIATSKLIGLREKGLLDPKIPIAWLDTDFVQRRFAYLHSLGVDRTFLAHPALAEERVRLGVPAEKMATTGLTINSFVFEPFDDSDRREFLARAMTLPDRAAEPETPIWINGRFQPTGEAGRRLSPDRMTVTIASGRAGVGDFPKIVAGLVREARQRDKSIQIIVVCGDNKKNFEAVTKYYTDATTQTSMRDVTLVVSRLVDNPKLLRLVRSSALFIGKSGSQSPFEAAVMGVPRVLIDVIGGQERWTANFFREHGLAEVVRAKDQADLARRAFAYLEDDERMAQRRAADQIVRESFDLEPIRRFYLNSIEHLSTDTTPGAAARCGFNLDEAR